MTTLSRPREIYHSDSKNYLFQNSRQMRYSVNFDSQAVGGAAFLGHQLNGRNGTNGKVPPNGRRHHEQKQRPAVVERVIMTREIENQSEQGKRGIDGEVITLGMNERSSSSPTSLRYAKLFHESKLEEANVRVFFLESRKLLVPINKPRGK